MVKESLRQIQPKKCHNYVGFFLTLACNLQCPYCVNLDRKSSRYRQSKGNNLTPQGWIQAANRLTLREDLALTLQGGEPTLFKGFHELISGARKDIKMDLLSNMMFDVDEFIKNTPVWRFSRKAPYAPIRVSYHPGQNDINDLVDKTLKMQDAGFRVGLYAVLSPDREIKKHISEVQEKCLKLGLDFRTKEYLGWWEGKLYGTYKYDGAVSNGKMKYCECKTTELIVDPTGYVYRCHSDLYHARNPISHILDENFTEEEIDKFRPCYFYGDCNPCDVKIKTNRFQVFGHTSVEIKNVRNLEETRISQL